MSVFSDLFDKSPARKVADEILTRYAKHTLPLREGAGVGNPDAHPIIHDLGARGLAVELPGFWLLTLDNVPEGVQAQILRPGMPGQDDPPILVKIYHYESLASRLWQFSIRKFDIYDLRTDAVYQVNQDFKDYYKNEFKAGARLTFVERHYLPYENGNTLVFKEGSVYLQDGDLVYERFADYVVLAPDIEQIVPARRSPFNGDTNTA